MLSSALTTLTFFSAIKNINLWKVALDYVLEQGHRMFKDVCNAKGIFEALAVGEPLLNFQIESINVSVTGLALEIGLFLQRNSLFETFIHHSSNEKENGAIFTCAGYSIAAIWAQNIYVFDSYSRNTKGSHDPNGQAVLLTFYSMTSVNNYIKAVLKISTKFHLTRSMTFSI